MSIARTILAVLVIDAALQSQAPRFRLEEATIADVHRAIQTRQITCRGRVGEIARADDPPDAILNRRIVVEEIEETSAAPECPPRSSPRS